MACCRWTSSVSPPLRAHSRDPVSFFDSAREIVCGMMPMWLTGKRYNAMRVALDTTESTSALKLATLRIRAEISITFGRWAMRHSSMLRSKNESISCRCWEVSGCHAVIRFSMRRSSSLFNSRCLRHSLASSRMRKRASSTRKWRYSAACSICMGLWCMRGRNRSIIGRGSRSTIDWCLHTVSP